MRKNVKCFFKAYVQYDETNWFIDEYDEDEEAEIEDKRYEEHIHFNGLDFMW